MTVVTDNGTMVVQQNPSKDNLQVPNLGINKDVTQRKSNPKSGEKKRIFKLRNQAKK